MERAEIKSKQQEECLAKITCVRSQQVYGRSVYPVCPVLQVMLASEKRPEVSVPTTNCPDLDSIVRILTVFEGPMRLRPNLRSVVRCAHQKDLLKDWIDPVRDDLSALSQLLEGDFAEASKNCRQLVAELWLVEHKYTMHCDYPVYLLSSDIQDQNWATFLEWRTEQVKLAAAKGFLKEIEMYRLTCTYPAETIKVMHKIHDELSPVVRILSERVVESRTDEVERTKTSEGLSEKLAEIKQEIKPIVDTAGLDKTDSRVKPSEAAGILGLDGGTLSHWADEEEIRENKKKGEAEES